MRLEIILVFLCGLLVACATQPPTDYSLTPAEMQTAGSATLNQQESVPSLYSNAEFVRTN